MARRSEGQNGCPDMFSKRLPHQEVEELVAHDDALDDVQSIGAGPQERQVVLEGFRLGGTPKEPVEARVDELLVRHG